MFLRAHPRRALGIFLLLPPAYSILSFGSRLIAANSPYHRTYHVHLGYKYVNHGHALPSEIGKGEDMACDNSYSVGSFGRDASFVNELTDNGFGKYIQEVK